MSALPINVWRACDAPKQPTSFMEYGEVMAAFDEMDEPEVADKVRQKAFVDFSRAVVERTKSFKGPEREPVWEYDLVDSAKEELGLFLNVDPPNTETDSLAILNIIRQEAMNFGLVVFADGNEFGFLSDGTVHSSSETIEPARADAYFEEKINQEKKAKVKAPKKQSLKQFAKQAFAKINVRMDSLGFVIEGSDSDTKKETVSWVKTIDQHEIEFVVSISTFFAAEGGTKRAIEATGAYTRLEQSHPSMYTPNLMRQARLFLQSADVYKDEKFLETDWGRFVIETAESLEAATDILLGPFLSIFEAVKTPVDLNQNAFNPDTDAKRRFSVEKEAFVKNSWLLRNPEYLEHLIDGQNRVLSSFGVCTEWLLDQLALDSRPQVPEADLDHYSRLSPKHYATLDHHFKTNVENVAPTLAERGYQALSADPTEPFVKRWTRNSGDIRVEFIAYSFYRGRLEPQMGCVCIFYSDSFLEASKKIGLGELGTIIGASTPFYLVGGNAELIERGALSNWVEKLNKPLTSINRSTLDRLDQITDLVGVAQVLNRIKEDEHYPANRFPFSWRHVLLAHLTAHPAIDQYKALWPTVACGEAPYFFIPNDPSRPRDSGFKGGTSANRITDVLAAIKNGVI
jgi:hypothetical protein